MTRNEREARIYAELARPSLSDERRMELLNIVHPPPGRAESLDEVERCRKQFLKVMAQAKYRRRKPLLNRLAALLLSLDHETEFYALVAFKGAWKKRGKAWDATVKWLLPRWNWVSYEDAWLVKMGIAGENKLQVDANDAGELEVLEQMLWDVLPSCSATKKRWEMAYREKALQDARLEDLTDDSLEHEIGIKSATLRKQRERDKRRKI